MTRFEFALNKKPPKDGSVTICGDCFKKLGGIHSYVESDHRVMSNMGPDSLCDYCFKENGGAVIKLTCSTCRNNVECTDGENGSLKMVQECWSNNHSLWRPR
jgi:zona occludens toxin (predicted ATPase)